MGFVQNFYMDYESLRPLALQFSDANSFVKQITFTTISPEAHFGNSTIINCTQLASGCGSFKCSVKSRLLLFYSTWSHKLSKIYQTHPPCVWLSLRIHRTELNFKFSKWLKGCVLCVRCYLEGVKHNVKHVNQNFFFCRTFFHFPFYFGRTKHRLYKRSGRKYK